jgi:hypothetical protein
MLFCSYLKLIQLFMKFSLFRIPSSLAWLSFFIFFFLGGICLWAQPRVIINEWSQGGQNAASAFCRSGSSEWVELLVVGPGAVDLRNYEVRTNANGPVRVLFRLLDDPLWQNVPQGTLIVVYNSRGLGSVFTDCLPPELINKDDRNPADCNHKIIVGSADGAVLSNWGVAGSFPLPAEGVFLDNSAAQQSPALYDGGGNLIHDWDQNNNAGFTGGLRPSSDGESVSYLGATVTGVTSPANWAKQRETPGEPNNAINRTWIESLRATPSALTPTVQNVSRCGSGPVTFTVNFGSLKGDELIFYRNENLATGPFTSIPYGPNEPNLVLEDEVSRDTLFFVSIRDNFSGCQSPRIPVQIGVVPPPATPVAPNRVFRCGVGNISFTVSSGSADRLNLYSVQTGGDILQTAQGNAATFTLANLTATATFWIEATKTLPGCLPTPRVPVIAELATPVVPPTPIVPQQSVCGTQTLTLAFALEKDIGIRLFTSLTGDVLVTQDDGPLANKTLFIPEISQTSTYYLETFDILTGCAAPNREPLVIAYNPSPSPPISGSFTRCNAGTLNITAQMGAIAGAEMSLFSLPTGGEPLQTVAGPPFTFTTPTLTTSVTYYLEALLPSGNCVSERTPVALTLNIVTPPTVPQLYGCADPTPIVLRPQLGAPNGGSIIRMLSAPTGGILLQEDATPPYEFPLTLTSATGNRTYYFEAIDPVTQCTSARTSAKPVLYVLDPPQAQTNVPPRCGEGTFVLRNLNFYTQSYRYGLYTTPSGGTALREYFDNPRQITTPSVTTTTTFYLEGIDSLSNCPSIERTAIVARVTPLPAPPTATYTPVCGAGSSTISVTSGTGNYGIYETQIGGQLIAAFTSSFATPELFSEATYWIEAIDPLTQCTSRRSSVIIKITEQPAPPIAQVVPRCTPGSFQIDLTMGVPAGSQIKLFTVAAGGAPIATTATAPYTLTTPEVSVPTSFYLETQDSSGSCVSATRATVITPFSMRPARPTTEDFFRCGPGVATLTITPGFPSGSQMLLYTLPTGGTPIAADNTPPFEITTPFFTATATLYLAAALENRIDCSSDRLPLVVHIRNAPGTPTAPALISRCGPGAITLTAAMSFPAGEELRLYTTPVGGVPQEIKTLAPYSFSLNADTTRIYYLEAYLAQGNCPSQSRREVLVRVAPIPAAPLAENRLRCGSGGVTFTIRANDGATESIRIFTQPTAGAPLLTVAQTQFTYTTPPLNANTTYYLESVNTEGNCVSERRTPIIAQIADIPAPPQAQSLQRCGEGPVTFTLQPSINPANIELYTLPQGGNAQDLQENPPFLFTQNVTRTTAFYFATQDPQTGCRSENRVGVIAEVLPEPLVLLPDSIAFCKSQTLTINPDPAGQPITSYSIFASFNAPLPLATLRTLPFTFTTPELTTSTTYYVQATASNGCSSARTSIRLTREYAITPPSAENIVLCGPGAATFTVFLAPPAGDRVALFTQANGGAEIANANGANPFWVTTPIINQNAIFYLEARQSGTGCPSLRTPVTVSLAPLPELPRPLQTTFCTGDSVFTLNLGNTTPGLRFSLYASEFDDLPLAQDTIPPYALRLPNITQNTTFYLSSQIFPAGCARPGRLPVPITLNLTPGLPFAPTRVMRCGPGLVTFTASMTNPLGQTLQLYTSPQALQPIDLRAGFPYSFTLNLTTNATYYLEALSVCGNCKSPRLPIELEVQEPLPSYSITGYASSLCQGDLLTFAITPTPEPGLNILWQGASGWRSTQYFPSIPGVTNSDAGVYTLTLSGTDTACPPQRILTDLIQVFSAPNLSAFRDTALCQGENFRLSVAPIPGAAYLWEGPAGFRSLSSNLFLPALQPEQSGVYTLTATLPGNPRGCQTASESFRLSARLLPQVNLAPRYDFCQGAELFIALPALAGAEYVWHAPDNRRFSGSSLFLPNARPADSGVWRLEVKPLGCPPQIYTTVIRVEEPLPPFSAISNAPVCEGQTLTLSAPVFSGASYLWEGPGGFSVARATALRPAATPQDAGEYTLTITPAACPSGQWIVPVSVSPNISALIQSNAPICAGHTLRLTIPNLPLGTTVQWQGGAQNFSIQTQAPELVLPLVSQEYTGRWQARFTLPGCPEKIAVTDIEILPNLVSPRLQSNGPLCVSQRLDLTAEPAYPFPVSYTWQTPRGSFFTDVPTLSIPNVEISDLGVYRVIVNRMGCEAVSAITEVAIFDENNLAITTNAPVCEGAALILSAPALPLGANYRWSGKGIEGASSAQVTVAAALPGETYRLRLETNSACPPFVLGIAPEIRRRPTITATTISASCGNNGSISASVSAHNNETATFTLENGRGQSLTQSANSGSASFINLAPGLYTVSYNDGVCSAGPINVSVENAPLPAPALERNAVSGNSIGISWAALGNGLRYRLSLVEKETGRIIENILIDQTQHTFTGLFPDTEYQILAVAVCNGSIESAVARIEVRTLNTCGAIESIQISQRGNTGVILSWAPTQGAICYHIRYGALGTDTLTWISQMVPATLTPIFPALSLTPGVAYGFDLRVNCRICSGVTGGFSPWSERLVYTPPLRLASATQNETEVVAYPNPTRGTLYLQGLPLNGVITLADLTGRILVPSFLVETEHATLDISHFPKGWYILQISANGKLQNIKVRKED